MYILKKYGESKIDSCPFCQKPATTMNGQKVPVCLTHKEESLEGLKCVCGSTLDLLHGKFGVFFSCIKCGSMNLRKVLEINAVKTKSNAEIKSNYPEKTYQKNEQTQAKKEITVRSDDPRYFD